jgi:hypothetical protein
MIWQRCGVVGVPLYRCLSWLCRLFIGIPVSVNKSDPKRLARSYIPDASSKSRCISLLFGRPYDVDHLLFALLGSHSNIWFDQKIAYRVVFHPLPSSRKVDANSAQRLQLTTTERDFLVLIGGFLPLSSSNDAHIVA